MSYRRPYRGTQPEYLFPPYASTVKRAPSQPLVVLPHTLSELTAPVSRQALVVGSRGAGQLELIEALAQSGYVASPVDDASRAWRRRLRGIRCRNRFGSAWPPSARARSMRWSRY